MAKRRYGFDEQKIDRFLKEGRGTGHGKTYKPWLEIHDVSSRGRSSRVPSQKTGRIHHMLSDLERGLLLLLDWADSVTDIREQFPLDRDETRALAEAMGIRHPLDTASRVDIVMTTDFLVDIKAEVGIRECAYSVKPASELGSKRTLEKLEIERRYWARRDVTWKLVTDRDLPKARIQNLHDLHELKTLDGVKKPHPNYWRDRCERLLAALRTVQGGTIQQFVKGLEASPGFSHGEPMTVIRHLAANKILIFDLDEPFSASWPIDRLEISARPATLRRISL